MRAICLNATATEKMPKLLAECEKLPAAGQSDQFWAGLSEDCCSDPQPPTDGNNAPLALNPLDLSAVDK